MAALSHQTQPDTAPVTSDGLRRNQLALEALIAAASASGVLTFNTRAGAVTLLLDDVRQALGVTYATNALKVLRVNAGETGFELGTTSDSTITTATAGEVLGGNRAVYIAGDGKAYYADRTAATSMLTSGVTTGAAALGAAATIQTTGVMTNGSWTWTGNNPVWLSTTGLLTQTAPTTNFLIQVGTAMGPTKLLIEPRAIAQLT